MRSASTLARLSPTNTMTAVIGLPSSLSSSIAPCRRFRSEIETDRIIFVVFKPFNQATEFSVIIISIRIMPHVATLQMVNVQNWADGGLGATVATDATVCYFSRSGW